MTSSAQLAALAVPDASLVAKWYAVHEQGWEAARSFFVALREQRIEFAAPEHLKTEVVRTLQLGVRDGRYDTDEGLARVRAFLTLGMTYMPNDLLFSDAFRLASAYQMALYDGLY